MIFENILGAEHPEVATVLNNLARMYETKGYYGRAEPFYRRALAIREKTLGPEHPEVASSLNNLGGVVQYQGRLCARRAPTATLAGDS